MAGYKETKKQPSVMAHNFAQVPRADIPRSTFNLSHGLKTTFDADLLIPIGVWDVIPGDSWNVQTTILSRLATPIRPLMDNIYIDTFYFFVPYRIIWTNFEKFMGAQDDPADTISFTIPIVASTTAASRTVTGTLWDYFGLPINAIPDDLPVSSLPYRAMTLIWNDWFRDENLQDTVPNTVDNGPDALNISPVVGQIQQGLFTRAKKHDYFTSALPWPQKGATPVSLPLGTSARIASDGVAGTSLGIYSTNQAATVQMDTDEPLLNINITASTDPMYADLTNATAATINDLRLAFQTQKLLERDARSGTRYVETLKAHWGVTFPDYTAQRPVYLGGGSIPMGIHPVASTNTTKAAANPNAIDQFVGQLTGYGEASGQSGFTKSFVEHGCIIALVNGRGDITYSQGVDRYWAKSTRFDFYYPVLSGIGEQSILNKEIWITGTGTPATDNAVFGYTGRYNEYRFHNSKLTGLMRPDATSTLANWNLSEDFATLPALGDTFIQSNTRVPLDRAIAVATEPQFIADIWHEIKAARPLPLHGIPGQGMNF